MAKKLEKDEKVETTRFIMDFEVDLKEAVQKAALELKMAGDKDASGKSVIHGVLRDHLESWRNKRLELLLADPLRARDRFARKNLPQWEAALRTVFGDLIPSSAVWGDPEDIVAVLSKIAAEPGIAHMFMPTGGGYDLTYVATAREPGCIELGARERPDIFKPARLSFEAVGSDPSFAYFRLEAAPLAPAKVTARDVKFVDGMQDLTEMRPGVYEALSAWENRSQDELPEGARPVARFLRGSVVIFAKASLYNTMKTRGFDAYNAIHDAKTADEFREFVAELSRVYEEQMHKHAEALMQG